MYAVEAAIRACKVWRGKKSDPPDFIKEFVDELEEIDDWKEGSDDPCDAYSTTYLSEFLEGAGISARCPQLARLTSLPGEVPGFMRRRIAQVFAPCVPWAMVRHLEEDLITIYNQCDGTWTWNESSSYSWRGRKS